MKPVYSRVLGIYLHLLGLRDGATLTFKTVADTCPCCGRSMEARGSGERRIITLVGGVTTIVEEYFVCPCCKDGKTGRRIIRHSEFLRGIIPPKSKYGYDVEIEAGHLQYADNKQTDEMKSIFLDTYGISVSQAQIHELGIRFLKHMVVFHYQSAPLLAKLFEPGCVFHVDATCEAGRGMELTVREGWTGIVLGAWKIPTENEEVIGRHLRSVVETFGEPVAFVSDLGNGMMAAVAGVIQEMNLKSRQLVCHMHFLKAVGKSILENTLGTLKSQFKERKTLSLLNRFVKDTGNVIKPSAAAVRGFVVRWLKNGAQQDDIPGYLESVAVIRALAQWVILFGSECNGQGFPFELPHLRLFGRCATALGSLLGLLGRNCFHEQAVRYAERLQRILQEPVVNPEMQETVRDLKTMEAVFAELRGVLRLEKTDIYKQEKDRKIPDELEIVSKLKEETSRFRVDLGKRLESGDVATVQENAIRIVLDYLDQYDRYLFDHFFITHDASGNMSVKLIERTNNLMERSYRGQKHQIRRRTGSKNLGFVFEHLFPAAAMVVNLENPVYRQMVLGGKARGQLIGLFSSLDVSADYTDTPMFQDDSDLIGGRLPKADKRIVGKSSFTEIIIMLSNAHSMSLVNQEV